jgi:class 3 adenylate cyclase
MRAASQQALKLAACIGNQFRLQTLALVSGKSPSEVIAALQEAVTEGLILLLGDAYRYLELDRNELADGMLDAVLLQAVNYRFAHDKVQQAAYSLIPVEARQTVHRQIGLLLLNDTPTDKRANRIFDIVNQLNEGRMLATSREERHELAQLNLVAARRAKVSAAYKTAFNYLLIAHELLPENHWEEDYELSLAIHREAAEVAYLCTEFSEMERFVDLVLNNATELDHKIPAYETLIQGDIARTRKIEAISTGLKVLAMLKVNIPLKPNMAQVVWGLLRARLALAGKSMDEIIAQPKMTDSRVLTIMRVATRISSTAYVVDPNLFALLVLKEAELSARYGNAAATPFAFALYGTIHCGVLGDFRRGYRFGKMALQLQEKLEEVEHYSRTAFTSAATSQHYVEPLRDTFEPLLTAYKRALENGDLEFGGTNSGVYGYHLFFSGRNLVDVNAELTFYAEVLEQIRQEAYLGYMRLYLQVAQNLMGKGNETWSLAGPISVLSEYETRATTASDAHGLFNAYLCESLLRLFGEDYAGAVQYLDKAREHQMAAAAMYPSLAFHFYNAIACSAYIGECPPTEHPRLLRRIRKDLAKLTKLAAHCPANYEHKVLLVRAELLSHKGHYGPAMELYDAAIDGALSHGFLQEQALANEFAGRFYLKIGKERIARTYLTDAYHRFSQWGAITKVKLLESRYGELLATAIAAAHRPRESGITTTRGSTSVSTMSGDGLLDMASVLKASQVLSAEIHLDQLLRRLMAIVLENAGAQRGLLFLETDGKFYAEAEAQAGHEEVLAFQHQPIREREDIAQSIVNFVMRLKETVVLDDAANDSNFARDEYIVATAPKSLLCLPLIRHNRLDGLLYLENNLATGAFTPARLEVINMLAAEIVISLSNARLYDNLQKTNRVLEVKVEERTRDLHLANQELAHEKRKSDQLLLNVLPERVAEELKEHGEARPERFDNVTVFFSDFVAFTDRAATMAPEELLHELNDMFTAFDGIVSGNGCERIKTIGDAYLFVCGMPDPDPQHAGRVLECALEIRDYVNRRNQGRLDPWLLRMGIHSGPVVGGVVGIHKYIYDVFGDTINTAARMESHSEPMKINVSDTTRRLAPDQFTFIARKPVAVKGKGTMSMFFVEPPAKGEPS